MYDIIINFVTVLSMLGSLMGESSATLREILYEDIYAESNIAQELIRFYLSAIKLSVGMVYLCIGLRFMISYMNKKFW